MKLLSKILIYPVVLSTLGIIFLEKDQIKKLLSTSLMLSSSKDGESNVLVKIGNSKIENADIEWEYNAQLALSGLDEGTAVLPGIQLDNQIDNKQLPILKEQILTSYVERILLIEFMRQNNVYEVFYSKVKNECDAQMNLILGQFAEKMPFISSKEGTARLYSRICENLIVSEYLNSQIYANISVSDEEMLNKYNENLSLYKTEDKATIRQIVLPSEAEANRINAKATDSNFADLARKYSISPEAKRGGLMPPFSKGDLPHFFDVAFSMRIGEIRGVIKSTYGFHIIQLEAREGAHTLAFTEVKKEIEEKLVNKKKEEEFKKWVDLAQGSVSITAKEQYWW